MVVTLTDRKVEATLVKLNAKTAWVKLSSGQIIKRKLNQVDFDATLEKPKPKITIEEPKTTVTEEPKPVLEVFPPVTAINPQSFYYRAHQGLL